MKMKFTESGRTMVEVVGVLSVIGVLMYGAMIGIRFVMNMYRVTATYNDLEQAADDIQAMYSWKGVNAYNTDDIGKILCEVDLTPVDCSDTKEFPSRWPGVETKITGAGATFAISVKNLPSSALERLKQLRWNRLEVAKPADKKTLKLRPKKFDDADKD